MGTAMDLSMRRATVNTLNTAVGKVAGRWIHITAEGCGTSLMVAGWQDYRIGAERFHRLPDALRAYKKLAGKAVYKIWFD